MPELAQGARFSKDEQEIVDSLDELKILRNQDERRAKIKLVEEKVKKMKMQGKPLHNMASFFRDRADKARASLKSAGKEITKCCGE